MADWEYNRTFAASESCEIKNKTEYEKSIISIVLLLCISTVANAQDWENQQSMVVVNPNGPEKAIIQKTECLENERIIGLGATHQDSCYFISWFKQGITFTQSQVFSCGTIYDFAILEGKVYFCGQKKTSTDTSGFVGVFQVDDLIGGQFITYGIKEITETKTLTRLEAYKDADTTHIVAIGELDSVPSGFNKSCLVVLDDKNYIGFNHYILKSQTSPNMRFEKFSDIVVTDDYVTTVSFISPSSEFLIRRYDYNSPENVLLHQNYVYKFPNYTNFALALSGTLRMCKISGNFIAVGTSAGEVPPSLERYFVFLNYIELDYMGLLYSNEIPRRNKMNEILKMVYSKDKKQLLVLEYWNLYNQSGFGQSVTHIFPDRDTSYTTFTDHLYPDYTVNDMDVVGNAGKYFTIGAGSLQTNNLFIHTQNIADDLLCSKRRKLKVIYTSNSNSYQVPSLSSVQSFLSFWNISTAQVNTYQWNVECSH